MTEPVTKGNDSLVKCRCDVFYCNECVHGLEREEKTFTVDSRILPWNSVTYTESHVKCGRDQDVMKWRKLVYDRAWEAVEKYEDEHSDITHKRYIQKGFRGTHILLSTTKNIKIITDLSDNSHNCFICRIPY